MLRCASRVSDLLAIKQKDYKMRSHNFLVGLFVMAGLTIFTVGIFLVGSRNEAFTRHVEFYTEFTNLDGLTKGSKVKVAGMDAGQIVAVGVPDSPASRFRVKFQIKQGLQGLVRIDSVVTIATEGVVGETYLLVRPGSQRGLAAAPLTTLPSQEPVDMAKLLDRGMVVLQDADTTLNQVGAKLNGTLDGVTNTVANVNDVVIGLKQGRGPAGMLLQDKALASNIRSSLTNVQRATVDVRDATGQVDALVSDVRRRGVTRKLDETISSARDATANIDESAKQVRQTIAKATGPDEQGIDAATKIKESLSNINTASANMADDTEALKHNFLLRGFFHHRGYYNLADIPPGTYRKDHVFSNPTNEREWLPATELFTKDRGNSETLSAHGKQLLNSAIAHHGDSLPNDPIVVEGYSDSADPANQLASSRNRAILVREYLQRHFQIERSDLGIVSMRNSPPNGVGHSHWDGICMVFLRRR
jgi:phospholipid/cholesterol/gamma-HCH transport system substrate-binding protein